MIENHFITISYIHEVGQVDTSQGLNYIQIYIRNDINKSVYSTLEGSDCAVRIQRRYEMDATCGTMEHSYVYRLFFQGRRLCYPHNHIHVGQCNNQYLPIVLVAALAVISSPTHN